MLVPSLDARTARSIEQDGDARQLAALEELERRAAAGRDVGHPLGQALLGRPPRPSRRRRRPRSRPHRPDPASIRATAFVPCANDGISKTPSGPFQNTVRTSEAPHHEVLAGLAEVDDVPRGRDLLGRERLVLGAAGDLLGDDDVDRQHDADAVASRPSTGSVAHRRRGPARRGSCRPPCPARAGTCWPCRRRGRACRPWSAGGR